MMLKEFLCGFFRDDLSEQQQLSLLRLSSIIGIDDLLDSQLLYAINTKKGLTIIESKFKEWVKVINLRGNQLDASEIEQLAITFLADI